MSKFLTKTWIEVNDLPCGQYSANKNIRLKTTRLKSDLCDYSDTYVVVKRIITVKGTENANRRNKFNKIYSKLFYAEDLQEVCEIFIVRK